LVQILYIALAVFLQIHLCEASDKNLQ
jgi:hypothetical protein